MDEPDQIQQQKEQYHASDQYQGLFFVCLKVINYQYQGQRPHVKPPVHFFLVLFRGEIEHFSLVDVQEVDENDKDDDRQDEIHLRLIRREDQYKKADGRKNDTPYDFAFSGNREKGQNTENKKKERLPGKPSLAVIEPKIIKQQADSRGHALASPESEIKGEDMPDDGRASGQVHEQGRAVEQIGSQHGQQAFGEVKGDGCETWAESQDTEGIDCSRIFRALLADVDFLDYSAEDVSGIDRAKEIASQKNTDPRHYCHRGKCIFTLTAAAGIVKLKRGFENGKIQNTERNIPRPSGKGVAMKILTSRQMKEIDKKAIQELGLLGPILMENAGLQIYRKILEKFPHPGNEKIVIIAGKGNNGGDGFVVARHLFNQGADPEVLLLAAKAELKGDAAVNLNIAEKIGIKTHEVRSQKDLNLWKGKILLASLLVDAIFGTGLTKPAEGLYARVIELINTSKAYKVAVDIPSGLSSDTFQIIGPCVKTDLTVTLAAPKIAHVFPPAEECIGELEVADISVPSFLFDDQNLKLDLVEKKTVLPYFEKRKRDAHKGTYGHLFILSGSLGKTGAAVMAGKAALRMGTGLVTVGTPASCLPIVARSMAELMTEALPETPEKTLSSEALSDISTLLKGKDALMVGPGISVHPSTAELILSLLPKVKVPVVIDADALNILASRREVLKSLPRPAVLTPHPGEFARLLDLPTKDVVEKKLELVPQFAVEYGVYLVLKGYRTLTATPDGRVFINSTGNPGMATAGSGDVLSGMIASMIIQEKNLLEAVLAAVYIHGLSGDVGVEKVGEKPLTAGDIIRYLPLSIKLLTTSD